MARTIRFHPVSARFGARVEGVDLSERLAPAAATAIRRGLDRFHVLFFPGQTIDDDAHLALAGELGEPLVHPFERAMGRTDPVHGIVDREDRPPAKPGWHTDDSYLASPPSYGILRCEVAPECGGHTLWADMTAALVSLSPALQTFLSGLDAWHETSGALLDYVSRNLPPDRVALAREEVGPGAYHPIVAVHPESGTRSIYFEPNFVTRIEGLSAAESRFVCDFLASLPHRVSLQLRHRWRVGDVAIWDERTTQHTGTDDHAGQLRVLRRCTVVGARPDGATTTAPPGQPSRSA